MDTAFPGSGLEDERFWVAWTWEHLGKSHARRAPLQRSLHPTVVFVHGQPALSRKAPGAWVGWPRAHLGTNEIALMSKEKPAKARWPTAQGSPHTPPPVSGTSWERIQSCRARCEPPTLDPDWLLHCGTDTREFTPRCIPFLSNPLANLHFT